MALASIQALYDDDVDDDDNDKNGITKSNDDETDDRIGVISDPSFSIMSKIKLNLTPAIITRVSY